MAFLLVLIEGCATSPPPSLPAEPARETLPPPGPAVQPGLPPLAGSPSLAYPARMQAAGREGAVAVECTLTVEGVAKDCRIAGGVGGVSFYYAALDYVGHARYSPEIVHGVPAEVRHRWHIEFRLTGGKSNEPPKPPMPVIETSINLGVSNVPLARPDAQWASELSAGRSKTGSAKVSCHVTAEGQPQNCAIAQSAGDAETDRLALSYVTHSRYGAALRDGYPVEADKTWTIVFGASPANPLPAGSVPFGAG